MHRRFVEGLAITLLFQLLLLKSISHSINTTLIVALDNIVNMYRYTDFGKATLI